LDIDSIAGYWYAYIYEQQENQTEDAEYILTVLGETPVNVLEACCGGGRIAIPLAKAGHNVTGFDKNGYALERLDSMAKGMKNIHTVKMDAVTEEWGKGFDFVIMAGNLMINIESDMDYRQSQKLFIKKAAASLRRNGHLFLDFDCTEKTETKQNDKERVVFEGTDDKGTYGRYVLYHQSEDGPTRTWKAEKSIEIKTKNGEDHCIKWQTVKYCPGYDEVRDWLMEAGFAIESVYCDYHGSPRTKESGRAVVLARKE
jgi:SAM-dependent methyltransferase